jgi:hypothetical protein
MAKVASNAANLVQPAEADHALAYSVFYPHAVQRMTDIGETGCRFVHYTTASVALSIIENRSVWMRKASLMNDFSETEHGLECLSYVYRREHGTKLKAVLRELNPALPSELEQLFDGWQPRFRADTYMTCVSEHLTHEDGLGRLSMWRAYGGSTGVAVVLNNAAFLSPSDALRAYTSPVIYAKPDEFEPYFAQLVGTISSSRELLLRLGSESVKGYLFDAFRYAALSTKHPGFREEREWRVIHSPSYEPSDRLERSIEVVRGTPQFVYKIPLADIPEEDFYGASPPDLIDHIIIGPTDHPEPIREVLISLLQNAGVGDAEDRVLISDIPLRQLS